MSAPLTIAMKQRLLIDQPQQPAEHSHQQGAAEDAVPERLHLAGPSPHAGDHFGGRVHRGADQRAETRPDAIDRIAEHGAGCRAKGRAPDHRVKQLAGAASSASVPFRHATEYRAALAAALISYDPSMEARDLAVGLAGGRIAIGVLSLLAPGLVGRAMMGPEVDSGRDAPLPTRGRRPRPRPRARRARCPGPRRSRARLAASVRRGGRPRRGRVPARPPPPSPSRVSSSRRRGYRRSAAQRLVGRTARRTLSAHVEALWKRQTAAKRSSQARFIARRAA